MKATPDHAGFPKPFKIGRFTRWRAAAVGAYIAKMEKGVENHDD